MADRRLAIFAFIDAFGWQILKNHEFLEDELPFRKPVDTVFGYSSTCIPTILTGSMPREHGHFSCFYYNPKESPFGVCRWLSVLPKSISRRGRIRRYLSKGIGRYYGYTGYFQIYNMPFKWLPLFDYSEKKDLYQPEGVNNGNTTIFDYFRARDIPFHLSDWHASEVQNLGALHKDLGEGRIRTAYLYMAELDAILHEHGPTAPEVTAKVEWYEKEMRKVLEEARKSYDEVRLFVFSDHGQAQIEHEFDLVSQIESLDLKFGKDYVAVYDSTMVRMWFHHDTARQEITDLLNEQPHGRIVPAHQMAAWGCDFENHKYGELFYLVEPGVLINPSFMGEYRLEGMHGYAPEDIHSTAMLAASHAPAANPLRLDDHYAMMVAESEWAMGRVSSEVDVRPPSEEEPFFGVGRLAQ